MVSLRICASHLIAGRAETVKGGRLPLWLLLFLNENSEEAAIDLAVLRSSSRRRRRISAEDKTSMADNSLQRTAKQSCVG
jgi:hypothetical protein